MALRSTSHNLPGPQSAPFGNGAKLMWAENFPVDDSLKRESGLGWGWGFVYGRWGGGSYWHLASLVWRFSHPHSHHGGSWQPPSTPALEQGQREVSCCLCSPCSAQSPVGGWAHLSSRGPLPHRAADSDMRQSETCWAEGSKSGALVGWEWGGLPSPFSVSLSAQWPGGGYIISLSLSLPLCKMG